MLEFKVANAKERAEIYKFRYEYGVEKCGLKQRYADHQARTVYEPLDDLAELHICLCDGVLAGTSRTSYAINNNIDFYKDLYDIHDQVKRDGHQIVIASKLLMNKELVAKQEKHQSMSCAVQLLCRQYGAALEKGIRYTYLDCEHTCNLNKYYLHFGFKLHKSAVEHPDTGTVNVYVLDMHDIDHLVSVKSPLAEVYYSTLTECAV